MIELMLDKSRKAWRILTVIDMLMGKRYMAKENTNCAVVDRNLNDAIRATNEAVCATIECDLKNEADKLWKFTIEELPEWIAQAKWYLIDGVLTAYYREQSRLFPIEFVRKLFDRVEERRELPVVKGVKMRTPFNDRVELECVGVTVTQFKKHYRISEGKKTLLKLKKAE